MSDPVALFVNALKAAADVLFLICDPISSLIHPLPFPSVMFYFSGAAPEGVEEEPPPHTPHFYTITIPIALSTRSFNSLVTKATSAACTICEQFILAIFHHFLVQKPMAGAAHCLFCPFHVGAAQENPRACARSLISHLRSKLGLQGAGMDFLTSRHCYCLLDLGCARSVGYD